ncbi:hypothetical protein Goshw_010127 [Gossypium schwendimanii]|uniref:Uncharacterized protein n=1 Tax=Gossypium schwendimanii TaxID=34291 RepID=A0A7J9LFZ6_GOSSC|nr:hypothetical protein [Gossypium schwendimanii]
MIVLNKSLNSWRQSDTELKKNRQKRLRS